MMDEMDDIIVPWDRRYNINAMLWNLENDVTVLKKGLGAAKHIPTVILKSSKSMMFAPAPVLEVIPMLVNACDDTEPHEMLYARNGNIYISEFEFYARDIEVRYRGLA